MKHLFKILFVLIFFSLINLGYAATSKTPHKKPPSSYTVVVAVQNQGNKNKIPLYFQTWTPVQSGVKITKGLTKLQQSKIASGSMKIFHLTLSPAASGQLPQITLTFGYDQTDPSNSCTISIQALSAVYDGIPTQPQGSVSCQANIIVGHSSGAPVTTVAITMRLLPSPSAQRMHFTVQNDSNLPLTLRSTYPASLAGSLPNKILANSSSGRVAYTFNKPSSKLSISYGFSSGHYCTFSCTGSCFAATATPSSDFITSLPSSDFVTCSKGPNNIMHVNLAGPYTPGAKCLSDSAWTVSNTHNATCAGGKLTCNIGHSNTHGADCEKITYCESVSIQIDAADEGSYVSQLNYICSRGCLYPLSHARIQRNCARQVKYDAYLTKYYGN